MTERGPGRAGLAAAIVLSLATGAPVAAADWEVVPFAGLRAGGAFDDADSGASIDFDATPAWGVTLGRALGPDTRIEGTWSHQSTALEARAVDLDVDHLHVAGVYEPVSQDATGGYVLASAGLTRFDSSVPGASSETRFSLGVGGGARVRLDRRLSLRLEARGWAVLTSAGAGAICAGGCEFFFSGSGLFQIEASAGLAVAF